MISAQEQKSKELRAFLKPARRDLYRWGWSAMRRGLPITTVDSDDWRAGWTASRECDAALRAMGVR